MYIEKIENKLTFLILLFSFFGLLTLYLVPYRNLFMSLLKAASDIILLLFLLTLKEITF
jgi:hypothetical protein